MSSASAPMPSSSYGSVSQKPVYVLDESPGYDFREFSGYKLPERPSDYQNTIEGLVSGIDNITLSDPRAPLNNEEAPATMPYIKSSYSGLYLNHKPHMEPEVFLVGNREPTPIIKSETKIMPFIEEAFEKQTGEAFPHNRIIVSILDDKQFKQAALKNNTGWGQGLAGFALNNLGKGIPSQIFVKRAHLDSMMLTIGHEIGHVMSPQLPNTRDEEAKAISFSMAWAETIKKHNIAGIAHNINPRPAKNGLHDVAYDYVLELMKQGKNSLQVFKDIANGVNSITKKLEKITLEA